MTVIHPFRPQAAPQNAAERRERHLRLCQELIDIGMTLARAASARALADIASPPPAIPIPGSSAAALAQAEEQARHRMPDYGRLFTHLSRTIRQTMLLETHIAEARPASAWRSTPSPLPHSGPEHEQEHEHERERDTPRRETLERLDCVLATGASGEIDVEALLQATSETFGAIIAPQAQAQASPEPGEPNPASPDATDMRSALRRREKSKPQLTRRW